MGQLSVICTPACDEVLDGTKSLGASPVIKVPATVGFHRIRLRAAALSVDRTVTVAVRENETTVVREPIGE
jgi:hypothetical protein